MDRLGGFVGGLAQWLAQPADPPELYVRVTDAPDGIRIEVDAWEEDRGWLTEPSAELTLLPLSGQVHSLTAAAVAPGRFAATFPAPQEGLYRVSVRVADHVRGLPALRLAERELSTPPSASRLSAWSEAGLVSLWWGDSSPPLEPPRRSLQPRAALAAVVLAAYLLLLLREERRLPSGRGG